MATNHPLGTGTGAAQLPRFRVDFNDVWEHRDDGTEVIVLGTADTQQGHDHPLHEGMLVVCEEPGELQMTGVVRWRRIESGACWVAELDPRTLVYHLRLDQNLLHEAGPAGSVRHGELVLLPEAVTEAERARLARQQLGNFTDQERAEPEPWLEGKLESRQMEPARALTLGVEGTYEVWSRNLAGYSYYGDVSQREGDPVVLVDGTQEVDALVRVLRLPPDTDYPAGRRVWLAEPDWATLRPVP
jgi:hypothetical protein